MQIFHCALTHFFRNTIWYSPLLDPYVNYLGGIIRQGQITVCLQKQQSNDQDDVAC